MDESSSTDEDYLADYVNAGFNVLMQTSDVRIGTDEAFAGSKCQASMQAAYAAGIDKVIVRDQRIYEYACSKTLAELQASTFPNGTGKGLYRFIEVGLQKYWNEPNFYGVMLADEPKYENAEVHGLIYQTIKQVAAAHGKEVYIHYSLLPFASNGFEDGWFEQTNESGGKYTYEQAYRKYLQDFIDACGEYKPDDLTIDVYPYRGAAKDVFDGYLANLQIFADVCKTNDIAMTMAIQSYANYMSATSTVVNHAVVDEEMMRAQISTCLGLGVTRIAYYRYATNGGYSIDEGFFIDGSGNQTAVYTAGQKVIAEVKAFEKTILNYEYQGSNYFGAPTFSSTTDALTETIGYAGGGTSTVNYANGTHTFALIDNVTCTNDIAFVTELYDTENELYMYMLQNFIDPRNTGDTTATITVNFNAEFKVVEYKNGVKTETTLSGDSYSVTLDAGEAVYIIPLSKVA